MPATPNCHAYGPKFDTIAQGSNPVRHLRLEITKRIETKRRFHSNGHNRSTQSINKYFYQPALIICTCPGRAREITGTRRGRKEKLRGSLIQQQENRPEHEFLGVTHSHLPQRSGLELFFELILWKARGSLARCCLVVTSRRQRVGTGLAPARYLG